MNGQTPTLPTQQQEQPKEQMEEAQVINGQSNNTPNSPSLLKTIPFEIYFFGIVLLFGLLNYFNILPLSKMFPNQLGWLPHKQPLKQFSNITIPPISPTDQGGYKTASSQVKQTLVDYLPTILSPSFLPNSNADIAITPNSNGKFNEPFYASWGNQKGVVGITFYGYPNSQKITSAAFTFQDLGMVISSLDLEFAKSEAINIFSIKPRGEWKCATLISKNQYCENFWEEPEAKKGLGFLVVATLPLSNRLIFSFCEYTKEEPITYSWKSCKEEFAKAGVR